MRIACWVVVVFMLLPCPPTLAGQPADALRPGVRVRLTLPCELGLAFATQGSGEPCRVEGHLAAVREDTIILSGQEAIRAFPLSAATRVEVSRGTRSRWLAGAGIGFLIGASSTYVLLNRGGSTNPCDPSANQDAIGTGACVGLAALGGVAGAGLGALIGKLFRSECWQDVPVQRVRVTLGLQAGGRLGVGITLAF